MNPKSPAFRLFVCALALIGGEIAGFGCAALHRLWGAVAVAVAFGALAAWGWGARRALYPLVFAVGVTLALRTENALERVLEQNAAPTGESREMLLKVESAADTAPARGGDDRLASFHSAAGPLPLKVTVKLPDGRDVPNPGEVWKIRGKISGCADPAARYRRRRIWAGGEDAAALVRPAAPYSPERFYSRLRAELAWRLGLGLEGWPDLAQMVKAILLGERSGLPAELRQRFIDAGTLHVFAISGLHVMAVAMVLGWALGRFGAGLAARGLVMAPLLAGYVLLTGARPSVARAALMTCLYMLAPVFGRKPNSLAAWSATALVVYAFSPERIWDLGCTFSFAVMLGIVVWMEREPLLNRFGESRILKSEAVRRILDAAGFSLMAWVASVPVSAAAFGRITPGALLVNFAVIWCAAVLVPVGVCGLAASFLCGPPAVLCNYAAAFMVWVMAEISRFAAELPFANFSIEPWGWTECLLWCAGWAAGLLLARRGLFALAERRRRAWWR